MAALGVVPRFLGGRLSMGYGFSGRIRLAGVVRGVRRSATSASWGHHEHRITMNPLLRHLLAAADTVDVASVSNLFRFMNIACALKDEITLTLPATHPHDKPPASVKVRNRVYVELRKNEWVHFACHGVPNEQLPFKSAFSLHDGPFTIERIIGCELGHPEFAYLSACHTTVGYKEGSDEVIHLASAMQFAGFRSVIGSMWAVDDAYTKEITSNRAAPRRKVQVPVFLGSIG